VTGLAALVANLALLRVDRAAVGRSAIPRDVSKLAASIALHGLSLAVAGKVVRSAALVAGSRTRHTGIATTEVSSKSTPGRGSSASTLVGAVASKMARLTAGIAATAGTAGNAQRRAVSLDVAKTLTMIALLRYSNISL